MQADCHHRSIGLAPYGTLEDTLHLAYLYGLTLYQDSLAAGYGPHVCEIKGGAYATIEPKARARDQCRGHGRAEIENGRYASTMHSPYYVTVLRLHHQLEGNARSTGG
jgi:hypothetical protein